MVGIYVSGNSTVIADGAIVTGNEGGGIVVEDGSYASINKAFIEGNFGDGVVVRDSEVTAVEAIIKNNGEEIVFQALGVSPEQISEEKLKEIISEAIAQKEQGKDTSSVKEFLERSSAIAGVLSAEPFAALCSLIAASGLEVLKLYKRTLDK